ncbi:helix-turn-helix domain-containing protein [Streptomyces sp. NPDC058644]|uniref:helix-turn-helix domain-containing protein n=1 Tax=unclassified Streptomyces TaxID=2593676 RepID=UPI003650CF90
MGVSPPRGACRQCHSPLEQASGPGRKREYCDAVCRRRAQRERDGSGEQRARSALPLAQRIAEDLQVLSAGLLDAEHDGQPVEELLRCAAELAREVEYYTAAAVQDARSQGADWERVASAAGVSPATARNRWAESEVQRRMAHRASQRSGGRPAPAAREGETGRVLSPAAERAAKKVAAALSHLHRRSGLTIREVAEQTSLSPSYISRILSGERTPTWPVVCDLAELCGGDAAELSLLWESAHGMSAPARPAIGDAVARLRAALRGLYLAAGGPEVTQLRSASRGVLTAQSITDMLEGELVPGWEATSALVTALGGWPADIRPLWEAVHYAFLVCLDPVPVQAAGPHSPHEAGPADPGGECAPPELT